MVGTARAASSFRNLALLQRRDVKRVALARPHGRPRSRRAVQRPGAAPRVRARAAGARRRARGRVDRDRPQGRVDAPLPALRGDRAVGGLRRQARRTPTRRRSRTRSRRCTPRRRSTASSSSTTASYRRSCSASRRPTCCRFPRTCSRAAEEELTPREEALRGDFIYEPEPEEILERLLPVYLETEIYRALLESATSFLAAQMTAMRNASKNAGELIDTYTLQMNRARQAQITQEILEIVRAGALTQ